MCIKRTATTSILRRNHLCLSKIKKINQINFKTVKNQKIFSVYVDRELKKSAKNVLAQALNDLYRTLGVTVIRQFKRYEHSED